MKAPTLFSTDKRPLALGRLVGKGGEGAVYALADSPDTLVKYYTLPELASREAKVARMIAAGLAGTAPLIAFPTAIVQDASGKFAGFTMKAVVGHQPLHEIYSPGARKAAFPHADYRFLVRAAANICRAVASVHAADCVIGDINQSGILLSHKATAALIDADSFQVRDGTITHYCKVGVPEYTPPELQGMRLDGALRTPDHDAFGLAVVVFRLLWMGCHPYSGRYLGSGDMPVEKAIAEHRFAFSKTRAVGMEPPPGVPALADFPQPVAEAFEAAFSPDRATPRPAAKQWIALLEGLEAALQPCASNKLHHYPQCAAECPWCRMERLRGVQLFIPPASAFAVGQFAGLGAVIEDLEALWLAIEAVEPPPAEPRLPPLSTLNLAPSEEARKVKTTKRMQKASGVVLVAMAIFFLATNFASLPVCIGMVTIGALWLLDSAACDAFAREARDIELRWLQALDDWQKRAGNDKFIDMKADLAASKAKIEELATEENKQIRGHGANLRAAHLKIYLDRFQIRRYKIAGIGPSRLAALTSYGIETAADVTLQKVLSVPGMGPVNSRALLAWRQQLEAQFVYNASPTAADRAALNAIKDNIARKATELQRKLARGPMELMKVADLARQRQATVDPALLELHKLRTQAAVDLKYLGLTMPPYMPP